MPRIIDPGRVYLKAEAFGIWNSGKSTFGYSVCKLPPVPPTKKKIIVFTNQATYGETLDLFPKEKENFVVYQHRTLEEFEHDWDLFLEEFEFSYNQDKRGRLIVGDTSKIEKEVHAIVIDEGEFIFREGYIPRYAQSLGRSLKPPDYAVPRGWFITQMHRMSMLPCHFILCSQVGFEYEDFRATKADGTLGALQFRKTGKDTYRLPEKVLYLPSLSLHLFADQRPIEEEFTGDDGKIYKRQLTDELGRPRWRTEYYGEARKQKADREVDFVMKDPTVSKCLFKLQMMRKKVEIT